MKNTVTTFQAMKDKGEKISMLTAYDYSTAKLEDAAGINGILVGDSLGNVVLGYDTTIPVTVEDMIHHGAAVARGAKNSLVVVDMPFLSYQTSVYDAVVNAGKIMKETQCDCVKLEGGKSVCPQIKAITDASIPVMAHLGLTPQSVNAFGGFKVQGKTVEAAQQLIEDAKAVEEAGIWQVKYYLYYLWKRGVKEIKGKVDYPLLKKSVIVELSDKDIETLEKIIFEIVDIENMDIPPVNANLKLCKKCAYYDLCFI